MVPIAAYLNSNYDCCSYVCHGSYSNVEHVSPPSINSLSFLLQNEPHHLHRIYLKYRLLIPRNYACLSPRLASWACHSDSHGRSLLTEFTLEEIIQCIYPFSCQPLEN
ncbi:Uncharacterised protein [Chlamydia trachomatis]|nr:Uncharacterised protein [Chlamydia trachomatis]